MRDDFDCNDGAVGDDDDVGDSDYVCDGDDVSVHIELYTYIIYRKLIARIFIENRPT